jgi:hypothetical protein
MSINLESYSYVIYHFKLKVDDKGLEQLEIDISKNFSQEEIIDLDDRLISIDIGKFDSYILGNIEDIKKLEDILIKCKAPYLAIDLMPKIWDMTDISFITNYGDGDPNPELTQEVFPGLSSLNQKINNILKSICDRRYTKDDVLDKINEKGIESLNSLNRYILEK